MHLCGPNPELATILTSFEPVGVELLAAVTDRGRGDAGPTSSAQLLVGPVAAHACGHVPLQHRIGRGRVEPLDETAAVRVDPHAKPAARGESGKRRQTASESLISRPK